MKLSTKQNRHTDSDNRLLVAIVEGKRQIDWEFEVGRCKQLHLEWINKKVLMFSTGSYMEYPVTNHNGKEYRKECIHTCNRVTLLYSRNWHIINQLYFGKIRVSTETLK